MKLLLVDVGNSRIKWAAPSPRGSLRVAGQRLTALLTVADIRSLASKHPDRHLILACVVPKWLPVFEREFHGRSTIVSGQQPTPHLGVDYPKPAELGADRIAAAVAARASRDYPAILVSCGTAIAFTVLDEKGRLCGGAIAPGLRAQLQALLGTTAQLPRVGLQMPRQVRARSTRDAIRAGVLLTYLGGIKEIIARLAGTFSRDTKPRLILTGGDAAIVSRALDQPHQVRPLLVFEGLRIMGEKVHDPTP